MTSLSARRIWSKSAICLGLTILMSVGFSSTIAAAKSEQSSIEQKAHPKAGIGERPAMTLTCSPSADGQKFDCTRLGKSEQLTVTDRAWRWLFRLGRDPIAVLTLLLFIIGGLQVEISRRTAKRQLRAYISIDHIAVSDGSEFDPPPPNAGIVRMSIIIKNTGSTPASHVTHWADIGICRVSEEGTLTIPNDFGDKASVSVIAANATNTKTVFYHRPPTASEISEIETSVSAIYVFGRVEYRDIFGKKRRTNYRMVCPPVWPPKMVNTLTFRDKGNDAS